MRMNSQIDGPKVAIVGAGIAGLRCGLILQSNGINVTIFDKENDVGGRMRTSTIDGFQIDYGFHVMQTAYAEASNCFDFGALGCKAFKPGAKIIDVSDGKIRTKLMADPWRNPIQGIFSAFNRFLSFGDLIKIASLRRRVLKGPLDGLFDGDDGTTMDYLRKRKISDKAINSFFLPLFSGIFLESELRTSERLFRFIFRMMAKGKMVLPKDGIQAAPLAMAEEFGRDNIRLGVEINRIESQALRFRGEAHRYDLVIKAFAEPSEEPGRDVWTVNFDAPTSPIRSKHIMLNSNLHENDSIVAYVAVPSDIQPSYAPTGRSLVTATVVGDRASKKGMITEEQIEDAVRLDLGKWFGDGTVSSWKTLCVQHIPNALPETNAGQRLTNVPKNGIDPIVCGDHMLHGSVEGALLSGKAAASAALARLEGNSETIKGPQKKV